MATAIVCDNLMDMNVGNADGTVINATSLAIMDAGTQGTPQGVWAYGGTSGDITVQSSGGAGSDRGSQVYLRDSGQNFAANSTHRRLAYDGTHATTFVELTTTGGKFYACTVAGWITLGPTNITPSGVLFDLVYINNTGLGAYTTLQLNNGNGPGSTYGLNMETNPGGVTTHTAYLTTTPGSKFWFSLHLNTLDGLAELYLYDTSYAQVFHVTATAGSDGTPIARIRIGNNETGTSAGNVTYFENVLFDWSKAASPIAPVGPTNFWVSKTGGGGGTATATTIVSPAVTNVNVGDLVVIWAKWEGGNGGGGAGPTISDGAGSTFVRSVVGEQANNAGDPRSSMFYCLSSLASGSVTYTLTFAGGVSRTFRDICVCAVTPPSGSGALALDGTAVGNSSNGTATTKLWSNAITTAQYNGVAFCGYAEFGATIGPEFINGLRTNEFIVASPGNSALWMLNYDTPFVGAGSGTLSGANQYNAQIIAFAAGPAGFSLWPVGA